MEINWWAVAAATVAQFVVGAIWYTPIFGKLWGEINGFNKLSKEVQQEMISKMGPFYGLQLVVTILIAAVLAKAIVLLPDYSPYALAFWAWFGFVLPTNVSGVIFSNTESKWIVTKILVLAGGSLVCIMAGAAVLSLF